MPEDEQVVVPEKILLDVALRNLPTEQVPVPGATDGSKEVALGTSHPTGAHALHCCEDAISKMLCV